MKFLEFLSNNKLKLIGAGLTIGSIIVDGMKHEKELELMKASIEEDVLMELAAKEAVEESVKGK